MKTDVKLAAFGLLLGCLLVNPNRSSAFRIYHSIKSLWKSQSMAIDADDYEWRRVEFDDYKDFLIGAINDRTDLYLYLGSKNQATILQLLGALKQTFTVWLGPVGKAKPRIGIRFTYHDDNPFVKGTLAFNSQPKNISDILTTVEILREGQESLPADKENILTAVGIVRKEIFYELKIPIQKISPSEWPQVVRVELETSDPDSEILAEMKEKNKEMKEKLNHEHSGSAQQDKGGSSGKHHDSDLMEASPDQGGGSGLRGGKGGGRGGGRKGGKREAEIPEIPEPFKIDFNLKLASR